jgi:hypothetical protein
MTTQKHISTEFQGGFPRMIGQSPAQEFASKERDVEVNIIDGIL